MLCHTPASHWSLLPPTASILCLSRLSSRVALAQLVPRLSSGAGGTIKIRHSLSTLFDTAAYVFGLFDTAAYVFGNTSLAIRLWQYVFGNTSLAGLFDTAAYGNNSYAGRICSLRC